MSKIVIEKNPSEERLKELGVSSWAIWDGEILVTPKGGEPVRIVAGDLVAFHAGLDSQWEVVKPLRKHYSYDFPNGF